MPDPLNRIHTLKITILALVIFGVGVALLTVARSIADDPAWSWLSWLLGHLVGSGADGAVAGV